MLTDLEMGDLNRLEKVIYMDHGVSDEEGYQIFTPEFIVKDMVNGIGKKEVLDFDKTILEPASGDGAFTCRILLMRLKTIKENHARESLRALSTIYSVEMDEGLIKKQRDNIYTIMLGFADKHGIKDPKWLACLEDIILSNFIWGKTNIESDYPLVHQMPCTGLGGLLDPAATFYSWKIHDDLSYEKKAEEVES